METNDLIVCFFVLSALAGAVLLAIGLWRHRKSAQRGRAGQSER